MGSTETLPFCSIIIPVFNNAFYTRLCLTELRRCRAGEPSSEIIIVDNGSTDDTGAVLAEFAGDLYQVIRNPTNLGFATASNQGAALARGKYLVFLNNDVVVQPGWLQALVATAQSDPAIGAVGARLLYPDGSIQHAGVVFRPDHHPIHVFRGYPGTWPEALKLRDYQALTGACLLVERRLFEELNGFDEAFLNSYEDTDLCLRIRRAGRRVVYCPEAVAHHFESSTPGRTLRDERNFLLFQTRWAGEIVVDFEESEWPPAAVTGPASFLRHELETLDRQVRILTAQNTHLQRLLADRESGLAGSTVEAAREIRFAHSFDILYHPSPLPELTAGSEVEVPVVVVNLGSEAWDPGELRLAYHWWQAGSSDCVVWDGYRTEIEEELGPGQAVTLLARVQVPSDPGPYLLEWDAVKEGFAWMSQLGIAPYRQAVRVLSKPRARITLDGLPTILSAGRAADVKVRLDSGLPTSDGRAVILGWRWARFDGRENGAIARPNAVFLPVDDAGQASVSLTIPAPSSPGRYQLEFMERREDEVWIPLEILGGGTYVLPDPETASGDEEPTDSGTAVSPETSESVERCWPWLADEGAYRRSRMMLRQLRQQVHEEQQKRTDVQAELDRERQRAAHLHEQLDRECARVGELEDLVERYRNGRVMRLLAFVHRLRGQVIRALPGRR